MRVSVILSQPLAVDNPLPAENNTSLSEVTRPCVMIPLGDPIKYQTDSFPLRSDALLFIAMRFSLYRDW